MKTKDKILKSAFELFLERGLTDVSIDDVMSEVGVTKGAFYYHFKSKEVLLIEVINKYLFTYLDEKINALRESPGTAQEKIRTFLSAPLDFQQRLKEIMGGVDLDFRSFFLLLMEGVKKFPLLTRRYALHHQDMRSVLQDILEEGKRERDVSEEVDSGAAAFAIMANGEGMLFQWVVDAEIDMPQAIERSLELVWRGLTPEQRTTG